MMSGQEPKVHGTVVVSLLCAAIAEKEMVILSSDSWGRAMLYSWEVTPGKGSGNWTVFLHETSRMSPMIFWPASRRPMLIDSFMEEAIQGTCNGSVAVSGDNFESALSCFSQSGCLYISSSTACLPTSSFASFSNEVSSSCWASRIKVSNVSMSSALCRLSDIRSRGVPAYNSTFTECDMLYTLCQADVCVRVTGVIGFLVFR